jgi:glycosyltransferase involved in cell wall biosynthesis
MHSKPPLDIIRENSMLANKKVTVVLPAYNAAQTLKQTFNEIPHDIVDDIILIDDASHDATVEMARNLGVPTIRHDRNRGYGGNQKTCYTVALARGADIVVMLHPDYQYTPKLVTAMASMSHLVNSMWCWARARERQAREPQLPGRSSRRRDVPTRRSG